jgi:ankyrin repeat protein
VNKADRNGNTPLYQVAPYNRVEVVKLLVASGKLEEDSVEKALALSQIDPEIKTILAEYQKDPSLTIEKFREELDLGI